MGERAGVRGGQGSEVMAVLKQRSSLSHPCGHTDQYPMLMMGGWEGEEDEEEEEDVGRKEVVVSGEVVQAQSGLHHHYT